MLSIFVVIARSRGDLASLQFYGSFRRDGTDFLLESLEGWDFLLQRW